MRTPTFLCLALLVAACSPAEPNLLNISQPRSAGPDEFAIMPNEPLVIPEDIATLELPEPTPGGTNLADVEPEVDIAVALGGTEAAVKRGGVEPTIVTYASRFGVSPNIREELAAFDLEYRRQNDGRLLERLFSVNVYFDAYEPFELDQYAELERFRRAGVPTAAAPPNPDVEE